MKTIALEDIYASTILSFCENLAELGYRPKIRTLTSGDEVSPDMWFRYLTAAQQRKVASKLIKIEERDAKRFAKENKKRK